MLVGDFKQQQ